MAKGHYINLITKVCSRCHHRPRRGTHSYCIECMRAYNRDWCRRKRGSTPRPIKPVCEPGEKFCPKCERVLPIERFSKCCSKTDGLMSNCKDCDYIKQLAWRDKNRAHLRERERKSSQKWRDTHPGYDGKYNAKRKEKNFAKKLEGLQP